MPIFSSLESICDGVLISLPTDENISTLLIDSRKLASVNGTAFFAISGERNNGHNYIESLYAFGIRNFVVDEPIDFKKYPHANFLLVKSSLVALQAVAAQHRRQFSIPVIGITGSNGKTIIKEWLSSVLAKAYTVAKSPGSYNSQVGVPLSVWQLAKHHQLAVFEAGISKAGEMELLEKMVKPTIGIFSNLGSAHDEGFKSREEKIAEKLKLFENSDFVIYCKDHSFVATEIEKNIKKERLFSWGKGEGSTILWRQKSPSVFQISWGKINFEITFPFTDKASIENAGHCIAAMLLLKSDYETIQEQIGQLKSVPMRLELKEAINNCQLIDDSYNNDLGGLQIGINFLLGTSKKKKTVILSDIFQSGLDEETLVDHLAVLIGTNIDSFIGIGPMLKKYASTFQSKVPYSKFYLTTQEYLNSGDWSSIRDEAILLKGARSFQFEKIAQRLEKKIHGTVLEIDLGAMVSNLNFIKTQLLPSVKVMAMVKALAYGNGSEQVATLLQYHNVDYLGVAYADEGVDLRKNGIRLPIMVMNPTLETFATMIDHNLEPEIYSLPILKSLIAFLQGLNFKIHLKIDTGMHRLGFAEDDFDELILILKANPNIQIASVFSHLAGADEERHDEFTHQQVSLFKRVSERLKSELAIDPILHILNSSGILRFPDYQFNMVRLGIGLYGINPVKKGFEQLKPVATLKTIVSQVKQVKAGETIGYARAGKAEAQPMKIATIAIGYADGFNRAFSKGKGKVMINGKLAPIVGNVCMDMTMVDITHIPAKEGDEVIIFGKDYPIEQVASSIGTIPYEILTNTSERVKRVFYAESI